MISTKIFPKSHRDIAQPVPGNVTVCVTSCNRLDLLDRTLSSFCRFNPGGRLLISEDCADPQVAAGVQERYPHARVLWGDRRVGITASIDRLYQAVETDYLFHLEDDWEFNGAVNWTAAVACLEQEPGLSNICVRRFREIKLSWQLKSTPLVVSGARFRVMRRDAHSVFFGWSPNPGLLRTKTYQDHAPFSRMNPDEISRYFKNLGMTMAFLVPGVARHIGQGRHVSDPTLPPRKITRGVCG